MHIAGRFIAFMVVVVIISASAGLTAPVAAQTDAQPQRFTTISSTEVFVALENGAPAAEFARALALPAAQEATAAIDSAAIVEFLRIDKRTVLEVPLLPGADAARIVERLARLPGVAWAAPNRIYNSDPTFDPREYTPDDPLFSGQYHHPLMQTPAAWDVTEGQGMVIAILDDGIEITHPDLAANIWQNDDPPGGGDNDGNGYIDDSNGWAPVNNSANVNPDGTQSHGTHVAGLAAARTNNGVGVAGVAGQATLMPIKFYSNSLPWTSAIIAEGLRYAVDNGARITNMSYNVDGFTTDPVVLAALEYAYAADVLMFNSAGNNNELNPPRRVLSQMLFIANTTASDLKAGSSNYGRFVDLSAPGNAVQSTVTNAYAASVSLAEPYALFSGTSMATPNAAGVAALIWAANPTWTRDQVAARLAGTADSIDALNPTYAGLLGRGRVNAARALSNTPLAPPRVSVLGLPAENGLQNSALESFTLLLPDILDSASVTLQNFDLRGDGVDGVFGTADDIVVPLTIAEGLPYQIGDNLFTIQLSGTLQPDRYRFSIRSGATGLRNPFNQQLDGNSDGTAGDDFSRIFRVGYQFYGIVFEDWNGNGIFDAGEAPIANMPILLDLNGSGNFDSGEPRVLSNKAGWYIFSGVTPGTTTLRALYGSDYLASAPIGGTSSVTLGAAEANTRLDVGLYRPQAVYGYVFDDANGNGARDSGEAGLAGRRVFIDVNQNQVFDAVLNTEEFAVSPALAIPDPGVVTSTLSINNVQGEISDLNVTLTISHTYLFDLQVDLVAPDGRRVRLIDQRGSNARDFVNITLDDDVTATLSDARPTPGTAYRPDTPLSAFDGQSLNGVWSLVVVDTVPSDAGSIRNWRISATIGEPMMLTTAGGAYRLSSATPGNYVVLRELPEGWRSTAPADNRHTVAISAGNSLFSRDFGEQAIRMVYLPLVGR